MSKIVYMWMKVAELTTGLHIHIDGTRRERVRVSDYRIVRIETVGPDVIEIEAVKDTLLAEPTVLLHRRPTDEMSVFGVQDASNSPHGMNCQHG